MIRTAEHLALFITNNLKSRDSCRIYQDALDACWFIPGKEGRERQKDEIHAFAEKNRWTVHVHVPGGYGIVADFRHPEGGGRRAADGP